MSEDKSFQKSDRTVKKNELSCAQCKKCREKDHVIECCSDD